MNKTLAILMLLTTTACATIFSGGPDQINIHSNDPDAKILVNGNEIGKGSAVYSLPKGQTAIITASEKGCDDRSEPTGQSINGVTFINLIFWPFYLVDAATGDIHKADPTNYTVTPNCDKE
jgi:hypothetical protein